VFPNPELVRKRFLDALAAGASPTKAALAAQVSRALVYRWRQQDAQFAEAWDDAWQRGIDSLEDEAVRRGVEGTIRRIIKKDGSVVEMMQYSDRLLELLLKGRRPERFTQSTHHHNYSGQVDVEVKVKTVAQARQALQLEFGIKPKVIDGDYEEVDPDDRATD